MVDCCSFAFMSPFAAVEECACFVPDSDAPGIRR